jgi:fructose-1,6-bisphosphatase/inositol monophosphatase family enzyme
MTRKRKSAKRVKKGTNFEIQVNGHLVGIALKEFAMRALHIIRNERHIKKVRSKRSYSGTLDDVVTSADRKAQLRYKKSLLECFPGFGIIGEEKNLKVPCTLPGRNMYFTIDPLDGTKAYARGQSHGTATMIALVHNEEVIAACIGDVNSGDIYYYRPDSKKVHRLTEGVPLDMKKTKMKRLKQAVVKLRDPLEKYSRLTRKFVKGCKTYQIDGGSIGTWFAQLWKREVGAAIIPPGYETPWDSTPIIGISKKLGFVFLRPHVDDQEQSLDNEYWVEFDPALPRDVFHRNHDVLIVHKTNLREIDGAVRLASKRSAIAKRMRVIAPAS